MVCHGKITHPHSERKKCKFCVEVDKQFKKDFREIFGKNPDLWPFMGCLETKRMVDKIRTKAEEKVKCQFKDVITGKNLSEDFPICRKYAKKGKK